MYTYYKFLRHFLSSKNCKMQLPVISCGFTSDFTSADIRCICPSLAFNRQKLLSMTKVFLFMLPNTEHQHDGSIASNTWSENTLQQFIIGVSHLLWYKLLARIYQLAGQLPLSEKYSLNPFENLVFNNCKQVFITLLKLIRLSSF